MTDDVVRHLFATRQDRTSKPDPQPAQADDSGPVHITNPEQYATTALERAHAELSSCNEGGRNHATNATAYSLGRMVAAGLLTDEQVMTSLLDASERNGLLGEDGQYATEATIRSGLTGGARHPLNWVKTDPQPAPSVRPFDQPTTITLNPDGIERTTWWPKDLGPILRGETDPEPPPAHLERTDGLRLFYAGKVNGLIGESESGKTWVALIAVAQALASAHPVLYLDFEDTAAGIVERLQALGTTPQDMRRLTYISPDEDLNHPAERDLRETIGHAHPTLVIVDGYNAAMTLLGLQLTDNTDVTAFSLRILRPLKRTGACVVTIDHVTKSKEGRGSYAIGAQAKRADVDGCLIAVDVTQPFGRGQVGRLKLTVSKDRPGHVRAISAGAKNAGEALLRSAEDGSITASINAPDLRPISEKGPFRPTTLMQRVSEMLETAAEPLTRTAVKNGVTGNNDGVLKALDVLIREGFVQVAAGGGVASAHSYRVHLDPKAEVERPASLDRPFPSQGTGPVSVPPVPPSIGGTGDAPESVPHHNTDHELRWDQR